ncbi:MAG: DUF3098 domain-containing protein [Tannerella sp.]|jgi:uncharacterized membrane protein|nr:DUF3098 domain-containing protein [Tannerella sp.]
MKDFAFGKENFIVIAVAVVLIIIGFALMSGGGAKDDVSFNPAIFNNQRIVVAPIITVLGFALVIYGIIRKPKDADNQIAEKN